MIIGLSLKKDLAMMSLGLLRLLRWLDHIGKERCVVTVNTDVVEWVSPHNLPLLLSSSFFNTFSISCFAVIFCLSSAHGRNVIYHR